MARNKWLNRVMEFDHVIRINPDLTIDEHPEPHVYAPESVIETDDDGQILAGDEKAYVEYIRSQGWELLDGYSAQYGYRGPIMHASEYIGGDIADHILDNPGLYVACTVETLDDSEEAAGWVVCHREIELPHVAYRCPCCGTDVMGTQPICDDCELAGCERSQRGGNDRDWYECQRPDSGDNAEYHVQFCDVEANQDITSSPYAKQDATEVRLWDTDACIVAVEKNARSGMWHVSASDYANWTPKARKAWRDWKDAMLSMGDDIGGYLKSAGYE